MIRIGVSRADITPPSGIKLIGFAGRGETIGVHDALYATALVASDDERSVALVNCDLLGVHAGFTRAVREEVTRTLGLPPESLMIACTHTHYGPDLYREPSTPKDTAYQENLKHVLADLVIEAASRRKPATIGVGYGQSDIGVNRRERGEDGVIRLGRNPAGVIDRSVGVCRIDSPEGAPIAVLLNFATHPVAQGGSTCHISADYPGATRRMVEEAIGAKCLFLQGAGANINPVRMEPSYVAAESLGRRLACETIRIWEAIEPREISSVASAAQTVALPCYRYGSLENAERIDGELAHQLESLERAGDGRPGEVWWVKARLEGVRSAIESWRTDSRPTLPAEFQALALGGLGLVSAPGEVFNELGTRVKGESPFADTFFVGYANDSIGYLPVREAYDEGGYEVTHACRVDPDASEILVRTCGGLLNTLSAAEREDG